MLLCVALAGLKPERVSLAAIRPDLREPRHALHGSGWG